MEFVRVLSTDDLPEGQVTQVEIRGKEIAIANIKGKFFAIDNTCLHQGGPLGQGQIEDESVVCPMHGWMFNMKTGASHHFPHLKLETYEVKIEGKDVLVKV